jgi:hypothetical protein
LEEQKLIVELKAGGSTFTTTASVLMRREPASALALLVRDHVADAVAVDSGLAATSWADEAQAAETVGSARRPVVLVLDRDAGTIALLLEWLRDGEHCLGDMPGTVLRRLQLEAAHWAMRSLAEQCGSRLSNAAIEGDEARHLDFLLGQLTEGINSGAVCRSVVAEMWKWLGEAQSRRVLACAPTVFGMDCEAGAGTRIAPTAATGSGRGGPRPLLDLLADALVKHAGDGVLARSALGCCALLGASCAAARSELTRLRSRLVSATERVEMQAAMFGSEKAGDVWVQAAAEAERFRRVLKLCAHRDQ